MKSFRYRLLVAALAVLLGNVIAKSQTTDAPPPPPMHGHHEFGVGAPMMGFFAKQLNLTDDQKAQIDKIHQSMKTRTDAVIKDEKLTPEQRDAMLAGYQRMERGQVFKLLTAEQQKEVRKRIRARHVAEQEEKKKQFPPK